jgi:hypothetical protein
VVEDATAALMDVQFGVAQLDADDQQAAYALLRGLRQVDFGA